MENSNIFQEGKPENEKPLDLKNIESDIRKMDCLLKTLEEKTGVLPKVDKEGNSDCPFARALYSVKEEAEEKITNHLKKLRIDFKALRKEISGCRKNLQLIKSDSNHIHLADTLEGYSKAEGSLETYYKTALDVKASLAERIASARDILDKTKEKKWPLGKARMTDEESVPPLYGTEPLGSQDTFRTRPSYVPEPDLSKEIDGLMDLGPMPAVTPGYSLD